jgi:hypothetical protein
MVNAMKGIFKKNFRVVFAVLVLSLGILELLHKLLFGVSCLVLYQESVIVQV